MRTQIEILKPSTSYELFTELNRDLIDGETNRLTLEVVKEEKDKDKDKDEKSHSREL